MDFMEAWELSWEEAAVNAIECGALASVGVSDVDREGGFEDRQGVRRDCTCMDCCRAVGPLSHGPTGVPGNHSDSRGRPASIHDELAARGG